MVSCSIWSVPFPLGGWIPIKEVAWQTFAHTWITCEDYNKCSSIPCLFLRRVWREAARKALNGENYLQVDPLHTVPKALSLLSVLLLPHVAFICFSSWTLDVFFSHKFPCCTLTMLQFKSRRGEFLFLVPAYRMLSGDRSFCPKWSSRKRTWQQIKL